jgi:hypothetical protein
VAQIHPIRQQDARPTDSRLSSPKLPRSPASCMTTTRMMTLTLVLPTGETLPSTTQTSARSQAGLVYRPHSPHVFPQPSLPHSPHTIPSSSVSPSSPTPAWVQPDVNPGAKPTAKRARGLEPWTLPLPQRQPHHTSRLLSTLGSPMLSSS